MLSTYQTTDQGKRTRAHLLKHLSETEELSREELSQRSGLTYDQVRRQTKNLCIDGTIKSRIEGGKRVYRLRRGAIAASGFLLVLGMSWAIPVKLKHSVRQHGQYLHHSHGYRTGHI